MISFFRAIRFAFQNIWRNFWLSVITVTMLVLTLLSVNMLLVVDFVASRAAQYVEDRIEVSVYFKAGTPQEKAMNAVSYLRNLSQVRDVETVTADEALVRFKNRHAGEDAILRSIQEIGRNPFGPTLIIRANSAADFPFILEALDHPRFSQDIREKDFSNYTEIIKRIQSMTDKIRLFGLGLCIIFLTIATLIIFNTVRMGIFIHREEIGIMKLVGATDWFVRAPFLIEIILYSAFATAIVAAITLPSIAALDPRINLFFSGSSAGIASYFQKNGWMIFIGEFIGLTLINLLSTYVAMRRHLRV